MHRKLLRASFFLSLTLVLFTQLMAQSADSLVSWKASSQKTGEGTFEILFTTSGAPGWQLFSPEQIIEETPMSELRFADSSIHLEGSVVSVSPAVNINSP